MNGYYNYNNRSTNGINQVSLNETSLDYVDKILYCDSDGIVSAIDSTTNGFLKNTSASYAFSPLNISDLGLTLNNNSTLIYTGSVCSSSFTASKLTDLNNNLNLTASTVETNNKTIIFKDITGSNLNLTIIPNGSNNGNCIYDLPYAGSYQHYFNDNLSTAGVLTAGNGVSFSVNSSYPNMKITTGYQGNRGVINYGNTTKTTGQMINFISGSYQTSSNPAFQIFRADIDGSTGDGDTTILNKGLLNSLIFNNNSASSKIKIQNNGTDKLIVDNTNTTITNNLLTSSITASSITTNVLNANTFSINTLNASNINAGNIISGSANFNNLNASNINAGNIISNNITASNQLQALNIQCNNYLTCSNIIQSANFQCNNYLTCSNIVQSLNIQANNNITASNSIYSNYYYANSNMTASGFMKAMNFISGSFNGSNCLLFSDASKNINQSTIIYDNNGGLQNLNNILCNTASINTIYTDVLNASNINSNTGSFTNIWSSVITGSTMLVNVANITASLTAQTITASQTIKCKNLQDVTTASFNDIYCNSLNASTVNTYNLFSNNNITASNIIQSLNFQCNNYLTCSNTIQSAYFQCQNNITCSNITHSLNFQATNNITASNAIYSKYYYADQNLTASNFVKAMYFISGSFNGSNCVLFSDASKNIKQSTIIYDDNGGLEFQNKFGLHSTASFNVSGGVVTPFNLTSSNTNTYQYGNMNYNGSRIELIGGAGTFRIDIQARLSNTTSAHSIGLNVSYTDLTYNTPADMEFCVPSKSGAGQNSINATFFYSSYTYSASAMGRYVSPYILVNSASPNVLYYDIIITKI